MAAYYRYIRDNDLLLSHALITPQNDRSRSSSEQADENLHLRVVDENAAGIVVKGARMLATLGPVADEILMYNLPSNVRQGEEDHCLVFAVPAAIYDALRDEILEGRLEPGNLLSIKDVQARFGVSSSAVREALCQLAASGLVLAEEQHGFRVAAVSAADLEDVTRSRAELEMFTIRDAIANGDVE
jgi:DNA-binding transcriptional regulator YhcF (GntR family)